METGTCGLPSSRPPSSCPEKDADPATPRVELFAESDLREFETLVLAVKASRSFALSLAREWLVLIHCTST